MSGSGGVCKGVIVCVGVSMVVGESNFVNEGVNNR